MLEQGLIRETRERLATHWDILRQDLTYTLCVVMTLVGSLLPTLRAVRVDPASAMRADG